MKRIWFTQQVPFGHMPLRAGLGLCTIEELRERGIFYGSEVKEAILKTHQRTCKSLTDIYYAPELLCPKIYTTKTHRLSGEFYVVEGSRFNAAPVYPEIRFMATPIANLNLKTGIIGTDKSIRQGPVTILDHASRFKKYTFPELDLGFKGASFEMLINELLRLNTNATIDTPFFINKLEPIRKKQRSHGDT